MGGAGGTVLGQDQPWPWENTAVHALSGLAGEDGKRGGDG